jgi:hypothetical protein
MMRTRLRLEFPSVPTLFVACAVMVGISGARQTDAAAPAAQDVLQRSRAIYAGLQTYADSGKVIVEVPGLTEQHGFVTQYKTPRSFYFDFRKSADSDRYVIWSDADAFHTWWRQTGVQEDFPKGSGANAFNQADFLTIGAGVMIPSLIFAQAGLPGPFEHTADLELQGTEMIGKHSCYKLAGTTRDIYTATGREVNVRKLIVWIDVESLLIRQVVTAAPEGTPDDQFSRTTTTVEPRANSALSEATMKFIPPGGM